VVADHHADVTRTRLGAGHAGEEHQVTRLLVTRPISYALSPLPALMAAAIYMVASRQPVVGQGAGRINKPVTYAGLAAAVAGLVLYQTVLPQRFTGWLVLLAALMVTPYLVGAWRWLHS
jgi:hypothetical protein